MTIRVTLWERDQTVGNVDMDVLREYPLFTVDTVPHATRLADKYDAILTDRVGPPRRVDNRNEHWQRIVDLGRADGYGNVIRTSWVSVSIREDNK